MAADAQAFAPAKINLALHVTGQRADGYHLLDSLVVFADIGDTVSARIADSWSLHLAGPFAAQLSTDDNLVMRAARMTGDPPAALTLDKRLPVASGIGGGSADAAATLHALHTMDGRALPSETLSLGADVPVCVAGYPCRMRGIGEQLVRVPPLPALHICLVNPGRAVETPAVFSALTQRENAPLPEPDWTGADSFFDWLSRTRNDLEPPASMAEPAIVGALAALSATAGCRMARMSGSGATCFALFDTASEARTASRSIADAHPDWWCAAAPVRQ